MDVEVETQAKETHFILPLRWTECIHMLESALTKHLYAQ